MGGGRDVVFGGCPVRVADDGLVIGFTFLFGFGNVLHLALGIGVPMYVAPLVAPAVDLTVLGLLVGPRHLAVCGVGEDGLKPVRRLLLAASVVTLGLNVADPVAHGAWGKVAFDAVGPLLLIGWSEVGPGLLRALRDPLADRDQVVATYVSAQGARFTLGSSTVWSERNTANGMCRDEDELLAYARREDAEHRREYPRPISAENLRKRLGFGARRSRRLVAEVRAEASAAQSANRQ